MLRTTLLLLAAFFYTSPALAAWGENWGVMVWGAAPSAVPSIDGLGLGLLRTRLDRAGHSGASVAGDAWTDGARELRRCG